MATLTREKNGSWNIRFVDEHGNRQSVYLKSRYTEQTANDLKGIIEKIIFYRDNPDQKPDQRLMTYLQTALPDIREKLEKAGLVTQTEIQTIGQLWDAFESEYLYDKKPNTKRIHNQARSRFFMFFKESDLLDKVTKQTLLDWKTCLAKRVSRTTVAIDVGRVKCVLKWATDEKDLFVKSPARGIKKESYVNKDRAYHVTMDEYEKILTACTTQEQRTILTLARIGGLRPGEVFLLTWYDIKWEKNLIWIKSPKTEHHDDKKGRFVPLWEPIRRELEALQFADEPDGKDDRIFRSRDASSNLRTRFEKIQNRAGLVPIPKFFTNCRASRSTEVFNQYGAICESAWIGHSQEVARRHYYQVRDEDICKAMREFGAPLSVKSAAHQELPRL